MKVNRILIVSAMILMIFVGTNLSRGETGIYNYAGENILYRIRHCAPPLLIQATFGTPKV